ncbi:MAG: glycoside hydrolase family 2, partial [Pirellulaceae bacterium]|nr:glycoside hydrolase family 2 [Pirellulaceae bacterium]
RCQSILQSGQPDNDVLLYWPIHDAWTDGVRDMTVHNMPAMRGSLGRAARLLWTRGYGFDYVSDRQLETMKFHGGVIKASGGATWRVVVVPECRHLPPSTLQDLLDLAQNGATVIFENRLPTDVPGLGTLEERRAALREQLARLGAGEAAFAEANSTPTTLPIGRGRVLVGRLEEALVAADVRRETLVDHPGILFVRRRHDEGRHYFVVNHGPKPFDAQLPLATPARSVVILDPMTGQTGIADARREKGAVVEVRVRLEPGHSLFLRTFESKDVRGPRWTSNKPLATLTELGGPWHLDFVTGGPELPGSLKMNTLESWTNVGDESTRAFAGTARYRCLFDLPEDRLPVDSVVLDLGEVKHVARVYLNDECLGASIMRPHRLVIPAGVLRSKRNVLDIEVTNLAANRIRDLDRRKIPWKIFRDANVVNIRYRRFDAADWPIFDSGLLGPVRIRSVESAEANAKEM